MRLWIRFKVPRPEGFFSPDRRIVPVSVPTSKRYKSDWDALIHLAEKRRPDIIELKLIIEAERQRLIQAESQALPQLNGVAQYQWNGLSGTMPNGVGTTSLIEDQKAA